MNLMSSAWRKTLKQADTPDFGIADGGILQVPTSSHFFNFS